MCGCDEAVNVKLAVVEDGKIPVFKTTGPACADCYARGTSDFLLTIPSFSTVIVPLGFKMEIPEGYYAEIRPRSGLSSKGINVAIGTIDSDYRGEVGAIVTNMSVDDFQVHGGDRIAQIMIKKIVKWPGFLVGEDSLSSTERGNGGFGSTGSK